ncbi:CHAT domain-containing protein [Micromonospora sp. NPDC005298]|uniref:CHAT domain-containing protein n=1 Tax=Micromonospora sp. NPDC005298 TaxID=3156873 RepID=UPI0033B5312D
MVSFYLSYSTDGSIAGRLIDDALTDRFGVDNVIHDFPGGFGGQLLDAAALIVVVGPGPRAAERLRDPLLQRQLNVALGRRIPVVPVLVGDAILARESDLPESLRPLADYQFWHIGPRTIGADIGDLVDRLASSYGTNVEGVRPAVPLILGEEPARLPHSASRPGTVFVYADSGGRLAVADSGQSMADGVFTTRYEVDISERTVLIEGLLPSRDDRYHFRASFIVRLRVTDPAQVVRAALAGDRVPLLDVVLARSRPVTRQFGIDETAYAEAAVDRLFASETAVPGGVTLLSVRPRLGLEDEDSRFLREKREWRLALLEFVTPELLSRSVPVEAWQQPARAAPPSDSDQPVSSAPPDMSTPDAARQPGRLLVARAPARVPVGRELSVEVWIVTEGRPTPRYGASAPMPRLLVADGGTPVTVTVHAPPGLHADGPLQQTVLVERHEDPAPIRFGFGAGTAGRHRIDVTAWAGGTFLAEVSVEVSVADDGPFRDGPERTASMADPEARLGEVTMEVRFDGSRYTFQVRSHAKMFTPVVESVTNSPNAAVENAIRELQQVAGGGSRDSPAMTRAIIRSAGIQLWSELVPADVRDQFWEVGSDMRAFTIATDYDVVPWELLYPLSAERDDGFLVERVPVVRRTYGQRRTSTIGLRNPHFVVPTRAPTGAREEVAAIRAILGAGDGEPITRADELLALINSGALGATHFACHNTFSSDGSFIDMDGGRFKPALLAEASIRKVLADAGPLVFINACRSAGVAPTYTRMLGWAQQFMSSGAGAFVGTLWAVRSESSVRFATAFYRSLAAGATLGAAALAARTDQQDDLLDPTWLAYTIYGDPFATAAV